MDLRVSWLTLRMVYQRWRDVNKEKIVDFKKEKGWGEEGEEEEGEGEEGEGLLSYE